MAKAFFKERRRGPQAYSAKKKKEAMAQFDRFREEGRTISKISAKLGISEATLYRWQSERGYGLETLTCTRDVPIDDFICFLCRPGATRDRIGFLEAVLAFAAWLRWPNHPQYFSMGMVSFLASYFRAKGFVGSVECLSEDERNLINKHLTIADLFRICVGREYDFPIYTSYMINESVDDRDVLAGIFYILHCIGKQENPRKSASLSKAFHLIQSDAVSFSWYVGRRSLDKTWRDFGAAAPFLFIERYHSGLSWSFEPGQENLVQEIDDLFDRAAEVRSFFQHAKEAVSFLRDTLDARALPKLSLPNLPDWLPAAAVRKKPLTAAMREALRDYSRSSKYLW